METPIGTLATSNARAICGSSYVRVVTVEQVSSSLKTFDPELPSEFQAPVTHLLVETLRTVVGPHEPRFTIDVYGGTAGGITVPINKADPHPVVGQRYMVAFHYRQWAPPNANWPVGQLMMDVSLRIADGVDLPGEAFLSTELEAFCDDTF